MQWRLAVVEGLVKGGDNLVCASHMRMGSCKTTHPITKLSPSIEISNLDEMNSQKSSDDTTECVRDPQPTINEPSAISDPLAATMYIERLPPITEYYEIHNHVRPGPEEDVGND